MDKTKRHILIAVGLTAVTIVVLRLHTESLKRRYKAIDDPVRVLVSIAEVAAGSEIEKLGAMTVPGAAVHPETIRFANPTTGAENLPLVKGAVACRDLRAEQVLLWSDIVPKEGPQMRDKLSHIVKPGHRAMTIQADVRSVHDGLLKTGDRVDVICLLQFPRKKGHAAMTLLQNVMVLAVGGKIHEAIAPSGRRRAATTVTMEVSPQDAELLVFAQQKGDVFTLTLRQQADSEQEQLPVRDFWEEIGGEGTPPPPPPPPDDFIKKVRKDVGERLKEIRGVKVQPVGDNKLQVTGVWHTEAEKAQIDLCCKTYTDENGRSVTVENTTNPSPEFVDPARRK